MDYFDSFEEAEKLEQQATRSAVVLAKLRYNEQLAPFVKTSKERLDSSIVQNEIGRILIECATETGADVEKVRTTFDKILADIATTQPEKETLPSAKGFPAETYGEGAPSGKDQKDNAPGNEHVETTDVNDKEPVLEDEILKADEQIDITKPIGKDSCVRCHSANTLEGSPVCGVCNATLVAMSKKKEALAPASPAPQQQQQLPPTHVMPLNPNSPYQCTVCGRTGTWDEVNKHVQTAVDPAHVQAKSQLAQQEQGGGQQFQTPQQVPQQAQIAPQQAPAYHGSVTAGQYEDDQQQQKDPANDTEGPETPSKHFDDTIQNMANRAAARHYSKPDDNMVNQIASAYGLDAGEITKYIQGTADFGNYHAENGIVGESGQVSKDYTEIDLSSIGSSDPSDSQGNGIQSHEAIVPVNLAIKKVSDDLGMDPNSVYSAVKDAYGGDLSDEYHISVQGEYHYYLPREIMDKATTNPQPQAPQQQQQPSQQPQQMPQAQPGMNLPQPDTNQMGPFASHYKLNDQQLEVLLTRDGHLADQRLVRR